MNGTTNTMPMAIVWWFASRFGCKWKLVGCVYFDYWLADGRGVGGLGGTFARQNKSEMNENEKLIVQVDLVAEMERLVDFANGDIGKGRSSSMV